MAIIVMRIIQRRIYKKTAGEFLDAPETLTLAVEDLEDRKFITAILIHPKESLTDFTEDELKKEAFTVSTGEDSPLIEEAYFSDINGNEEDQEKATHITLLLSQEKENALPYSEDIQISVGHKKFNSPVTKQNPVLYI